MDTVAVLVPCHNEALTIAKVVADFREALPEATIYVYDNNSSDGTAEVAEKSGAIVRREPRQGKGCVLRSMLRDIDAQCYLLIDGDDTYPAASAREIVRAVLEGGADFVIGDRLSSNYFTENTRPFHNFGNKMLKWLANALWADKGGKAITDAMTGMRGMSRTFAKAFPVLSKSFEMESEITVYAIENGFNIVSVPIEYKERPEGSVSKLNTLRDGTKVTLTMLKLFAHYRPLYLYVPLGLLALLVSLCLGLSGNASAARTFMANVFMVAGLVGLGTGLLCDRINLMHRQANERALAKIASKSANRANFAPHPEKFTIATGPCAHTDEIASNPRPLSGTGDSAGENRLRKPCPDGPSRASTEMASA